MSPEATRVESIVSQFEQFSGQAAQWLFNLVFPPSCENCGRVDHRFCEPCRHELISHPLEIFHKNEELFDGLCATGEQSGVLENAVKAFKYHGATSLSDYLGARLAEALSAQEWKVDAIVPVPLHADRQLERGYNQSNLLSEYVALALNICCQPDWLTRIRGTSQQARLSSNERRQNVKGAFHASAAVEGQSILLIDDVVTTGATLTECAAALRASQAHAVYGIAVSHA